MLKFYKASMVQYNISDHNSTLQCLKKGSVYHLLKRPYFLFSIALMILLLVAISAQGLAEGDVRFSHTASYDIGGFIDIDREIGDPCTTGASKRQTIKGYGEMIKAESIRIAPHIISIEDEMDWRTADDAVRNLSVTSTIDLCARPMSASAGNYIQDFSNLPDELFAEGGTWTETAWPYSWGPPSTLTGALIKLASHDIQVDKDTTTIEEILEAILNKLGIDDDDVIEEAIQELLEYLDLDGQEDENIETLLKALDLDPEGSWWGVEDTWTLRQDLFDDPEYEIERGDLISPYHPLVVEGVIGITRKTTQEWGLYLSPNPGEEGKYEADFIAAYGPGPYNENVYDEEYRWWYDETKIVEHDNYMDIDHIEYGDRYVGNYFDIDQYAYTSDGETRRFISISSPFSHSIVEEQMEVIGMAEVKETFELDNLEPGPDAITLAWYELF